MADNETLSDAEIKDQLPGDDPEHVRRMVDKAEGRGEETSPSADDVQYPDYIPEKYRQGSVEEAVEKMAEGYRNLESKLGKPEDSSDAKPEATSGESSTSETDEGGEAASEAADATQKVSLDDAYREAMDGGEVSTETLKALEESGLSAEMVDRYIEGQTALSNRIVSEVQDEVGGAEEYSTLIEWAADNMSEGEIKAYDSVMKSGDINQIKLAVRGLQASYKDARGSEPNLLGGQSDTTGVTSGYESESQMVKDMSDPRYRTDSAYRRTVEAKLARTTAF